MKRVLRVEVIGCSVFPGRVFERSMTDVARVGASEVRVEIVGPHPVGVVAARNEQEWRS